jgi:hypothetical protein
MAFHLRNPIGADKNRFWVGFGIILLVWGTCYLPNLRISPGWYGDEFVSLMEGNAILSGNFENRALKYSFFSTFTNYQPWGAILYSLSAKILAGGDILGARFLSIFLALLLVLLVYIELFRRKLGWVGFCAAFTILVAPQNTIHFRWVYPHFFVSLGVVLIGLLLSREKKEPYNDWWLGVGCALAALGHLLVVHVMAATGLSQILRPRSWIKIVVPPVMVLVLALLLGYWSMGSKLLLDLGELAGGYLGDSGRSTPAEKVICIYRYFFTDWFHVLLFLSYFGLCLLRKWPLLVFTMALSFAVIQNRPELPVFYYQSMIFIPLLCVNLMLSLHGIGEKMQALVKNAASVRAANLASLLIPTFFLFPALQNSWAGSHQSRNSYWVAPRNTDLEETAKWINQHTASDDLVVAFWDVGWLLHCRWTDPMQCAIWSYGNFPYFYNRPRDHSEFVFPANLGKAKYLLVGPLDMRWTYGQGTIPMLLKDFKVESWPTVFQTETTRVLSNPGL